jgi:REP element-mobilizing transposase RayT
MPRRARLESVSGYYHIMTRGINKEKIFETKKEKETIMTFIREKSQEEACKIAAYCIMNNHLHIIAITEKPILINVMKKINISYAMSYNQRHERIGPVFQDRFRSENINNDRHFYGVLRYIHNNPVNAGIVPKAEEYIWSSMREYLNGRTLLIDEKVKDDIMHHFMSKKSFIDFHNLQDETIYLEVKEETEILEEKRAKRIIKDYFEKKGINDLIKPGDKDELVEKLLKETNLSYRRIAKETGTSINTVFRANKKNRP